MLVASGNVEDTIAVRADPVTSYEVTSTYFVNYANDVTGKSVSWKRSGAIADLGGTARNHAHYMHAGNSSIYLTFSGQQLWSVDCDIGWQPIAYTVDLLGYYAINARNGINVTANAATIDCMMLNQATSPNQILLSGVNGSATSIVFRNCCVYTETDFDGMFRISSSLNGMTLEFQYCSFSAGGYREIMENTGWTSGTLKVNNCLFDLRNNGRPVLVPSGVSYQGNNNIFIGNDSTNLNLSYNGTTYGTIAAWRTATGQDANSLGYGPLDISNLWAGTPANGDFRLGASGTGATAAAMSCGAQSRMDWNARAKVSGQPTAWPIVPATRAAALTYAANPTAWTF